MTVTTTYTDYTINYMMLFETLLINGNVYYYMFMSLILKFGSKDLELEIEDLRTHKTL